MKGRILEEVIGITKADVAENLGGLPAMKTHCPNLAADGFYAVIRDYLKKKETQERFIECDSFLSSPSFFQRNGLYPPKRRFNMVMGMGCRKWFDKILEEAGVEVTDENREKVDEAIHQYVGEQSSYGRCSADWRKARKEIQADEKMRKELI